MIIAIDGPAGVGKSTIACLLAERHNLFNLNSGLFYRAAALKILDEGVQDGPEDKLVRLVENTFFDIVDGKLFMDGKNVESCLHNDKIDHWSSVVSTIIPIRAIINKQLRRIAASLSLVAEGRDMTTVVFPNADVKIYLTADPKIRAKRRFEQRTSQMSLSYIEKSMQERDWRDMNKEQGALHIAEDALLLDTSILTINEVYEIISARIKNNS